MATIDDLLAEAVKQTRILKYILLTLVRDLNPEARTQILEQAKALADVVS